MPADEMSGGKAAQSVNPYSTGGGGTVFEHHYGAVLLSHLLARTPIPALGDHILPTLVQFQARDESPVDDLLVVGRTESGDEHRLSIGARHKPRLVKNEKSSVKLIETYLQVVTEHWPEVEAGRWRLALAVAPSCTAAIQLNELVVIASAAGSNAKFRTEVKKVGRTTPAVRTRLERIDEIAMDIVAKPAFDPAGSSALELTWRLLSKLSVIEPRLEGTGAIDRGYAVERLQPQTPDGQIWTADKLFSRLIEYVGSYSPGGARVTRDTLCADLRGHSFFKQPDDEDVAVAAGNDIAPTIRAEAVMRGPIQAIDGLAESLRSAEIAAEADPSTAAKTFERVAQSLDRRGFRGHAVLIRQNSAKHLEAAGHRAHAADVLIALLELLVKQGVEHEAQLPVAELRTLLQSGELPPEAQQAGRDTLVLYEALMHPFDDLSLLAKVLDSSADTSGDRKALYALVLSEAAVATGQVALVADRANAMTSAAGSTGDNLSATRIRLSLAEASGNWSELVQEAKLHKLPRQQAALVLARYARSLTLTGNPDEAEECWWEAINRGALAELGDDTAEWLYAARENVRRYGPITPAFETHPLAQAMRLSKGHRLLPSYRDHYSAALGELRNGELASACESARRALRDAVTCGHLVSEMVVANLLADIYTASGEAGRAATLYVRTGQADKVTEVLMRLGDQYVDLTEHLKSAAPWQRYATYKAIIAQGDLIEDERIEQLVHHALDDFEAGQGGRIRQAPFPFGPHVEIAALDAIASLVERATPSQVTEVLELLEPLVPRAPNTYRHSDSGHVQTLAAILDRDDEFGSAAAKQLLDLLALSESVSQQVLELAGDAITRRVDLFDERLPTLIETSFTAAWLLARLGMTPPPDSQAVQTAFQTLTAPYQEAPGVFPMGLPLSLNAMLVRHLSQEECETAARTQLARAQDHGQPAMNRWESIDALRVLSRSVSPETKQELFKASIAFAQGLEDGSALDEMTGPAHPLGHFKVSLGIASLAVPGILLAAATSNDSSSAELVERIAAALLNQSDREITGGAVQALSWLGEHQAALPAAALAIHGDPNVRSLAAVRWTRQALRDKQVGLNLASDPDYHVRISLASAIAGAGQDSDDALMAVQEKLRGDPRHSVRRAAGSQPLKQRPR